MKMKKILSSLTAGAILATTVVTASLASSVNSLVSSAIEWAESSEGEVDTGAAYLAFSTGGCSAWTPNDTGLTNATVDGNGSFTASFAYTGDDSSTIDYLNLYVDINPYVYAGAQISIDSITLGGVAATSEYCSSLSDSTSYTNEYRNCLQVNIANWNSISVETVTDGAKTVLTAGDEISVTFSVTGLDVDSPSIPPIATSTTTTEPNVTTSAETSGDPTTTTESQEPTDVDATLNTDADGNTTFAPNGATSATVYFSANDGNGTFGYNDAAGNWDAVMENNYFEYSGGSYEYTIPSDLTGDTITIYSYYPDDATVERVVLHYNDTPADTTTTTESSQPTTTTAPVNDVTVADPTVDSEVGDDGSEYYFVDIDPDGAHSVTLYFDVTSNDNNASLGFGYMADEWTQQDFTDVDVVGGSVSVTYEFESDASVKAMIFYPGIDGVDPDSIYYVLHYSDTPSTTTVPATTTTEADTTTDEPDTTTTDEPDTTTTDEPDTTTTDEPDTTTTDEPDTTTTDEPDTTTTDEPDTTTTDEPDTTTTDEPDTTTTDEPDVTTNAPSTTVTPSVTTAVSEEPKGMGVKFDIDELVITNADDAAENDLYVNVENMIDSYGLKLAIDIPEVTARLIRFLDDGGDITPAFSAGDSAFSVLPDVENYSTSEAYELHFGFTSNNVVPASDGRILSMTLSVDYDNAATLAAEYGLPAQTDSTGTYYDFPIYWSEYGTYIGTVTDENGNEVELEQNLFELLDGSGNSGALIDWQDNVVTWGGAIRVYTDAEPVVTTTTTEAPEEEMPINLNLDTVYMYPAGAIDADGNEVPEFGAQAQPYSAYVTAEDGYDATSGGIKCAILFPDSTANLIRITEDQDGNIENSFDVRFGNAGASGFNLLDITSYFAGEAGATPIIKMGFTAEPAADPTATGLVEMSIEIPDEDTVKAIAAQYGIELQTDENGVSYYEFPVIWADQAVDGGWTVDGDGNQVWVEGNRFQYMDASGAVDLFGTQVGLKDGAIRVVVDAPDVTTTTTEETTTTTEEETTTTTTATTTTTTEEITTTTTTTETVPTVTTVTTTVTTTSVETSTEATTTTTTEEVTTTEEETTTVVTTAATTTTRFTGSMGTRPTASYPATTTTEESTTEATTTESVTTTTEEPATTTSTEAETTTTESATTTEEATTTEPAETTVSYEVEILTDAAFFFSVDDRDFVPSDLMQVTAHGEDGSTEDVTDQVTFNYASAKAVYDDQDNAYCTYELTASIGDVELPEGPTIYIGIKGDTNLNGDHDLDDMFKSLLYYASARAGVDYRFVDNVANANGDAALENFIFFLSDIDTESKTGRDGGEIALSEDCFNNLIYYANVRAGTGRTWPQIVPSLLELEGSYWAS